MILASFVFFLSSCCGLEVLWKKPSWEPNLLVLNNNSLLAFTTFLQPPDLNMTWGPAIAARLSTDGGNSFGPHFFLQDNPTINGGQADPVACLIPGTETVVAAWMNDWSIEWGVSTQFPYTSWTTGLAVNTTNNHKEGAATRRVGSDNQLVFADKPWIAATGTGAVAITFNSQFPYVVWSKDGGKTWGAPIQLDDDSYYYYFAGGGVTVGDDSVALAYLPVPNGAVTESRVYGPVQVYVGGPGRRFVKQTIFNSTAVSQKCPAWAQCQYPEQYLVPSVALAGGGGGAGAGLFAAFTGSNDTALPHSQAWISRSLDLGQSWSKAVAVSEVPATAFAAFPAVAAGCGPVVVVGWMDNAHPRAYWNVRVRISLDMGVTFGAVKTLSGLAHHHKLAYKLADGSFKFPFGDYWSLNCVPLPETGEVRVFATWGEGSGWYVNPGNSWFDVFTIKV